MASYSTFKRGKKHVCQVRWTDASGKRKSINKSFSRKPLATTWGANKVEEIEHLIAQGETFNPEHPTIKTLGQLIDRYLNDPVAKIGRSKKYALRFIRDCDIAAAELTTLTPKHITDFCRQRVEAGVQPQTIAADISHLRSVLKVARALYDINISETPIVEAMPTLHALGLVAKSNIRSRRPTAEELERLRAELIEKQSHRASKIPMTDILDFSILTCMRIGEVCKITWSDLNEDENWVWIRDRKDPRKKAGNHMKVPLLGGSMDIIQRQPRTDDRIFPYNARSVSASFQRTRTKLSIKDLRYHDLRREGASRLFEMGYGIEDVAQVTGHRDLNILWRIYTDLSPNRIKPKT